MDAPLLSSDEVRHIAALSRLELTEAEVAVFAEQLSTILAYVKELETVATDDAVPTAHSVPVQNVFRDDLVLQSLKQAASLSNTASQGRGCFKVPRVLEGT